MGGLIIAAEFLLQKSTRPKGRPARIKTALGMKAGDQSNTPQHYRSLHGIYCRLSKGHPTQVRTTATSHYLNSPNEPCTSCATLVQGASRNGDVPTQVHWAETIHAALRANHDGPWGCTNMALEFEMLAGSYMMAPSHDWLTKRFP